MTSDPQLVEKESRGRPRNPDADAAICGAALQLLAEQGYAAMSVESVATAAGVSKATLYRRFKDKRELVIATLSAIVRDAPPLPDTGDIRQDLLVATRENMARMSSKDRFSMLGMFGAILVQAAHNPEFLDLFREHLILPRRQALKDRLRSGIARGELRRSIDLDVVADFFGGSTLSRHLSGLPLDEPWAVNVVDDLLDGIAAGSGKKGTKNG